MSVQSKFPVLITMGIEWIQGGAAGTLKFHNQMMNMDSIVYSYERAGLDPYDPNLIANARTYYNRLTGWRGKFEAIYAGSEAHIEQGLENCRKDVAYEQERLDNAIALKAQYDASRAKLEAELAAHLARDLHQEARDWEKEAYESQVNGLAKYKARIAAAREALEDGSISQSEEDWLAYTDGPHPGEAGRSVYQVVSARYEKHIAEFSDWMNAEPRAHEVQQWEYQRNLMQGKLANWPDDPDVEGWRRRRDDAQALLEQAEAHVEDILSQSPGDLLAAKMLYLEQEFVRIRPGLDPNNPYNEYPDLLAHREYVSERRVIDEWFWDHAEGRDEDVVGSEIRLTHDERNWWYPPFGVIEDPGHHHWSILDTEKPNVSKGWRDNPPRGAQVRYDFGTHGKGPWSPTSWCRPR